MPFDFYRSLLNPLLRLLGYNKDSEEILSQPAKSEEEMATLKGTSGLINVQGVIGQENGKTALLIDFDLGDTPSWVEWDVGLKQISVAQNGGAVAIIQTALSDKEAQEFGQVDKLLIATNIGKERVVHAIPFIIRHDNDNNQSRQAEKFNTG